MKLDAKTLLLILLVAVSLSALLLMYFSQGISWDLVSQYLYGKGITSTQFISKNFTVSTDTIYSGHLYIELFREPLQGFVLGAIGLLISNPNDVFLIYLLLLFFAYLTALYNLAKALNVDKAIVFALFLNPFAIYFMFIFNSSEIMASIFLLVALSYIIKGSAKSGFAIALAGLSKHTTLILAPLVLFLGEKKKIIFSVAAFAIPTALWLVFNWYYFGNPFLNYFTGVNDLVLAAPITQFYPQAILSLLQYPIVYAVLFAFLFVCLRMNWIYYKITRKELAQNVMTDKRHLLAYSSVVLAFIGWLLIEPRLNAFEQARLGFPIQFTLMFMLVVLIGEIYTKLNPKIASPIPIAVLGISIILMANFIVYYNGGITNVTTAYNIQNSNNVYANATSELAALNLSNCKVISNAWVYMRYENVMAYSYFYPNISTHLYPIIDFNASFLNEMPDYYKDNESNVIYSNNNFSISLPKNYYCFK